MWDAKIIKYIRLKAMMSQQAFATSLGVSISTVSRWEMDKFLPTYSAQKRIIEFCKNNHIDVSSLNLLGG